MHTKPRYNGIQDIIPATKNAFSRDIINSLEVLSRDNDSTTYLLNKKWICETHPAYLIMNTKQITMKIDLYKNSSFPANPHVLTNFKEISRHTFPLSRFAENPSCAMTFSLPLEDFKYNDIDISIEELGKRKINSSLIKLRKKHSEKCISANYDGNHLFYDKIKNADIVYRNRICLEGTKEESFFEKYYEEEKSNHCTWNIPFEIVYLAKEFFAPKSKIKLLVPHSSYSTNLEDLSDINSFTIKVGHTDIDPEDPGMPGISFYAKMDEKNVLQIKGDKTLIERNKET
jgi:hypothetical protein